eukprot:10086114-Ditylum_brightwellii.AAC.1
MDGQGGEWAKSMINLASIFVLGKYGCYGKLSTLKCSSQQLAGRIISSPIKHVVLCAMAKNKDLGQKWMSFGMILYHNRIMSLNSSLLITLVFTVQGTTDIQWFRLFAV